MAPLPSAREIDRSIFDTYVKIFEQRTDPAAAWGAFYLARQHGFDIPAAINAEVDRFARAIEFAAFRLLTDMGTKDNKEVSLDNETVGRMWKNSVGRNPGTAIFMAWRSYEVAIAVARLCFDGSMPKTKAVKQVANDHRTNTTTVWNALKEHPDVFDLGALELGLSSYPSDSKEVGSLK